MACPHAWTPACAGVTAIVIFICPGGAPAHDDPLENRHVQVIPAKAGIHLLAGCPGPLVMRGSGKGVLLRDAPATKCPGKSKAFDSNVAPGVRQWVSLL